MFPDVGDRETFEQTLKITNISATMFLKAHLHGTISCIRFLYSGVCDRINTRTNVTFQISPFANEQ